MVGDMVTVGVADDRPRSRLPGVKPQVLLGKVDAALPEDGVRAQGRAVTRSRRRCVRRARREARNRCRTAGRAVRRRRWSVHSSGRSLWRPRPRSPRAAPPGSAPRPAPPRLELRPAPRRRPLRSASAPSPLPVVSLVVVVPRGQYQPRRVARTAGSASGALAATVEHALAEVKYARYTAKPSCTGSGGGPAPQPRRSPLACRRFKAPTAAITGALTEAGA